MKRCVPMRKTGRPWKRSSIVSETIKYDDSLVGPKVKFWWSADKMRKLLKFKVPMIFLKLKGKAPKKVPAANGSGFNQILGIKEAKQETIKQLVTAMKLTSCSRITLIENNALTYYLRTGTCKFGASCKFHRPIHAGESLSNVPLNTYGYPL